MDGGVRETLCSSCIHRIVCAHEDNYLSVAKSLQEMFYKFPGDEREFMCLRDPDCKFYSKELNTRTPLIRKMIFSDNDVAEECAEKFARGVMK